MTRGRGHVSRHIPVLLVSTATRWIGTARIPPALTSAGFDVSLLTPQGSLAEKSRFVSKARHLPENATVAQWVVAFADAVSATAPQIVVPCDDMAFRLLATLVRLPTPDLPTIVQLRLASLIRDSLGDPTWYDASVDKTRFPPAAEILGIRVPTYSIVDEPVAAEAFAKTHGYPVVLKRAHAFAGQGVAICASREHLSRTFSSFSEANARDFHDPVPNRHLIQVGLSGRVLYYTATAWKGDLLAGWASEKIVANPAPTGPPTVTRHFRSPRLREITASLARSFGISGHFFVEFMTTDDGGDPLVLEINRRITPGSHRGRDRNVDQWAALYARMRGTVSPSRTDFDEGEEAITVWFPEEWLRDPESRYLREYPVDVPWEDPELIEAFLAMRHEH